MEFGGAAAEPAYSLEDARRKGRDFSNPMYDAVARPASGEPLRECLALSVSIYT